MGELWFAQEVNCSGDGRVEGSMERQVTVLVTSAGSAPAVAVITALREQQEIPVRVVAADMDPLSVGFHLSDASVVVPAADDVDFEETLLRI
jgi:hypothetical protein